MKRPANPAEAQQWLIKFGRHLAAWVKIEQNAKMPSGYAEWVMAAVGEHLISGSDLGQALGLTRGRGRPADKPGIYFNLACQVFWKRAEGKSWRTISEETGFEDQRELQKIFERERGRVVAHYVGLIDVN